MERPASAGDGMDLAPLPPITMAFCAATVFLVAVLRGFTGFGFALVAVPLLSLALAPVMAVPLVLLLEVVASLQLLPAIWRQAQWRAVLLLACGAVFGTPIGLYALAVLPPETMRLAIALVVLATAGLMAAGLRFRGRPSRGTTMSAGLASGILNGGAAMSGPPIVLYFLASPATASISRASLVLYFLLADLFGVGLAAASGLVTGGVLLLTALLLPGLFLGQAIGARFFRDERQAAYRGISIGVLLLTGILAAANALRSFGGG